MENKENREKVTPMERPIERLTAQSLRDALLSMKVGETKAAPEGYSEGGVRRAVSELNGTGRAYVTSTRVGVQTITRLA